VGAIIYASSVGAYSAGPKDHPIDESWPTDGVPSCTYSREKAYVERILDTFETRHPKTRVVRLRPGFVFKRAAASGIRRLFAGPFLPTPLLHPRFIPLVPRLPELLFQAVHSHDVGHAFRLATLNQDVSGAFNLAADPALGSPELADLCDARTVPVPAWMLRQLAALAWHARLVPTEPGMVDLLLALPLMDTSRARDDLGWQPQHSATDALLELLAGMRHNTGSGTPPLTPSRGLPGPRCPGMVDVLGAGRGGRARPVDRPRSPTPAAVGYPQHVVDSVVAVGEALAGLAWVLRERRVVPPEVERGLRLLEEPQRHSRARRYVG
jgi:UDP-glucose 4-epimerase